MKVGLFWFSFCFLFFFYDLKYAIWGLKVVMRFCFTEGIGCFERVSFVLCRSVRVDWFLGMFK